MAIILILAAVAAGKMVGPVPSNDPGLWVTTDDYASSGATQNNSPVVAPGSKAEITGMQGAIPYELLLDPTGQIVSCNARTGNADAAPMEAKTCELVQRRARFSPALDVEGNPIAGIYRSQAMWFASDLLEHQYKKPPEKGDVIIPVQSLPGGLPSPTTVRVHVLVGIDGKAEACAPAPIDPKATQLTDADRAREQVKVSLGAQACPLALPAFKLKVAMQKKQPIRSVQTALIRFEVPTK